MQKKLIALAIASAMTVPALAYAEVNISGQVNMAIDNVNDGAATNSASAWQLNSNQSRVILKGSEDLGDGMSAIWQLDSRFNVDDGNIKANTTSANLFGGNNYLGVKSNFGSVMVGRMDSPYKQVSRKLDVFFDVAGDNRAGVGNATSGGGLLTHDIRYNNVLAYSSPSMSGFAVMAAGVFGGETPVANSTKGTGFSLAGTWTADSLYAALAYESLKWGTAGTGDLGATASNLFDDTMTTFRVSGGWSMDAFTVNALIEMPSYKVGSGASSGEETKNTNFYLGGKWAFSGSDSVRLAYTDRGDEDVTGGLTPGKVGNHASQIAVGYAHDMSKATSVYATYFKTSADPSTAADPSVLSFGMKHAF
jgi:predicted porin